MGKISELEVCPLQQNREFLAQLVQHFKTLEERFTNLDFISRKDSRETGKTVHEHHQQIPLKPNFRQFLDGQLFAIQQTRQQMIDHTQAHSQLRPQPLLLDGFFSKSEQEWVEEVVGEIEQELA